MNQNRAIEGVSNNEIFKACAASKTESFTILKPGQTHITVDKKEYPVHNSNGDLIHPSEEGQREFWAWFDGSAAVDDQGRPMFVYRGEHGKGLELSSRLGSWSFGSKEIARHYATTPNNFELDEYALNPKIFSAYLKITKPLINTIDDPFIDLSVIWDAIGKDVAIQVARDNSESILEMDGWYENFMDEYGDDKDAIEKVISNAPERVKELYVNAFRVFDNSWFVSQARNAGYDGAIHSEYGFHTEACQHAEFKVFGLDQVQLDLDHKNGFATQSNATNPVENQDAFGEIYIDNEESTDGLIL